MHPIKGPDGEDSENGIEEMYEGMAENFPKQMKNTTDLRRAMNSLLL